MRKKENTTANTIACAITEIRLVCPERNIPPEPGGSVNKRPGLSNINKTVGTIKSALVSVIPRTRAIAAYAAMKMRALSKISCTDVVIIVKTPGLST